MKWEIQFQKVGKFHRQKEFQKKFHKNLLLQNLLQNLKVARYK
jgi:hypothetical protein